MAAIHHGSRIGVLATLRSTLEPTSDLIRRLATRAGATCSVTAELAEGALDKLRRGDTSGHDLAVAHGLSSLAQRVDVIVLAQASMARALSFVQVGATVQESLGARPVLTSPDLGMQHVAWMLSA